MPRKDEAIRFLGTMRGQYIISQALYLAINEIEARPAIQQEPSNVADMRFLLDNLFPVFKAIQESQKTLVAKK